MNNLRSYSFGVTNGTRPGSIFSPKGGFGVYLDPLLHLFRESGYGLRIGFHWYSAFDYCDDLILLATSVASLQKLGDICDSHAAENDLLFSTDPDPLKSKRVCIAFHCTNKDKLANIKLNDDPLPWKTSSKYIGEEWRLLLFISLLEIKDSNWEINFDEEVGNLKEDKITNLISKEHINITYKKYHFYQCPECEKMFKT